MRLTRYTDYSLRVLIYLAADPARTHAIAEMAAAYKISRNHLMKVVNTLARLGFVETVRGRGGGLRLARGPAQIRIGDVVRQTEESLALADCGSCVIAPACGLIPVLAEGVNAMLAVFDRYTIADVARHPRKLRTILGLAA